MTVSVALNFGAFRIAAMGLSDERSTVEKGIVGRVVSSSILEISYRR
jgi:hypothetical protein